MFKRFTVGVAVGYILGARAGQKRYEQITDLAERAMELPWVERLTESGRSMAEEQGRRVWTGLLDRARWNDDGEYEDEDEGAYDQDQQDEEDEEDEEGNEEEDEGVYDEADENDGEEEDEGAYDEADEDEGPYDEADEDDGEGDYDEGGENDSEGDEEEPEDDGGSRRGRSRRGVTSVVSAARDRGRVA